jgi:hypothetical protein
MLNNQLKRFAYKAWFELFWGRMRSIRASGARFPAISEIHNIISAVII